MIQKQKLERYGLWIAAVLLSIVFILKLLGFLASAYALVAFGIREGDRLFFAFSFAGKMLFLSLVGFLAFRVIKALRAEK